MYLNAPLWVRHRFFKDTFIFFLQTKQFFDPLNLWKEFVSAFFGNDSCHLFTKLVIFTEEKFLYITYFHQYLGIYNTFISGNYDIFSNIIFSNEFLNF